MGGNYTCYWLGKVNIQSIEKIGEEFENIKQYLSETLKILLPISKTLQKDVSAGQKCLNPARRP